MNMLLILGIVFSSYLAFNIAANDVSNSIGTCVGSGSLTMRKSLILGGFFMFIGALFLGGNVARTIGDGIIGSEFLTASGALIIVSAASVWITFTLISKIPISGSDAIVSSVFGFGLAAAGPSHINFSVLGFIVLSWILSPLIGLAAGFIIYYLFKKGFIQNITSAGLKDRLEKVFSYLQVLSSAFSALNVGALDIAITTGVMFYALGEVGVNIKLIGAVAVVFGVLLLGGRVTRTVGKRITELVPTRGFSAQISMGGAVYFFVMLGMPISPTQTLVGSVIGVGLARGTDTLKFDVIRNIATTWIITIPACIALSAGMYMAYQFIF